MANFLNNNTIRVAVESTGDTDGIDKTRRSINDLSSEASRSSLATEALGKAAQAAKVGILALGAATAAATVTGFGYNSAVEQAETKMKAFMKDNEKVAQTLAWVKQEAAATQFSFTDMADAAANLTPVAKTTGKSLEELVKQAEILAATNPAEGLTGATFALREALSGDWTSIIERFNLPRQRINELKEQGVPAMELISKVMGEMGIDYSLVAEQGKTVAARFDQVKDKLVMLAGAASKPLFDRVSNELNRLGGIDFNKMGENMAGVMSRSLELFDKVAGKAMEISRSVSDFLRPAFVQLGGAISNSLIPAINTFIHSDIVKYIGGALVVAVYGAISALAGIITVVSSFVSQMSGATPILVGVTVAIVGYNAVVLTMTAATNGMAMAQAALNAVMHLNPFALVVGAAAGIVAAYYNVTTQSDSTKAAADRLRSAQDQLRVSTDAAKDAQDRLRGALVSEEGAALAVERAQRSYNDAVMQYGPSSLEAREAAHRLKDAQRQLESATAAVRDRTNEVKDAEQKRKEDAASVAAANNAIKDSAYAAAGGYAALANNIRAAREEDAKSGKLGVGKKETEAVFGVQKRASGGPVSAGKPYLVGDNRDGSINDTTELFVPRQSGTIVNSKDLQAMLGGGGGRGDINVTQHIYNQVDYDRGFAELGFKLRTS